MDISKIEIGTIVSVAHCSYEYCDRRYCGVIKDIITTGIPNTKYEDLSTGALYVIYWIKSATEEVVNLWTLRESGRFEIPFKLLQSDIQNIGIGIHEKEREEV